MIQEITAKEMEGRCPMFTSIKTKDMSGKKELLSYLVNYLKDRNIENIIFATETGEYTEKFYKEDRV